MLSSFFDYHHSATTLAAHTKTIILAGQGSVLTTDHVSVIICKRSVILCGYVNVFYMEAAAMHLGLLGHAYQNNIHTVQRVISVGIIFSIIWVASSRKKFAVY